MGSASAWPPCRAARQTRANAIPVSQQQRVVADRGLRDGASSRQRLRNPGLPARSAVQLAGAEEGRRGGGPLSPGSLMTAPRPTPCR